MTKCRYDCIVARDRAINGVIIKDIAFHDCKSFMARFHFCGFADEGSDDVTLCQRLFNKRSACSACSTDNEEVHSFLMFQEGQSMKKAFA